MLAEFVSKILSLNPPNTPKFGDLQYTDKKLDLIVPPSPKTLACSTLQGLVDLLANDFEDVDLGKVFLHIDSPTEVAIISVESDEYGRRREWARATYPEVKTFPFGSWLDPEQFIIAAQQHFQRAKIESDDGSFLKDLDYVLQVASKISAEQATEHEDDGVAQRVTMRQGVALKSEKVLQPLVTLAPRRTFVEVDQVLSTFVFRARIAGSSPMLALFEADGGRWKVAATAAIKAWLEAEETTVKVIS